MKSKTSVFLIVVMVLTSCATKIDFPISKIVPGAEITAKVKTDKNDIYKINLKAENLTSPNRLNPPKNFYVVWAETTNGMIKLGKLNTSSSLISSRMKGSLEATSAFKPLKIIISAEDSLANDEPSDFVITSSDNF